MSATVYDALIDEMTSFWKAYPESPFSLKMNGALRISGYAKSGVRGILRNKSSNIKFHTLFTAPLPFQMQTDLSSK